MGIKCGIVGLPNVGKSTLFNALTAGQAEVCNYPFTTIESNLGMVVVPDPRLAVIARVLAELRRSEAPAEVRRQAVRALDAMKFTSTELAAFDTGPLLDPLETARAQRDLSRRLSRIGVDPPPAASLERRPFRAIRYVEWALLRGQMPKALGFLFPPGRKP